MRTAPSLRYSPGLDGVRALAVLSVFVYHLGTTSNADYLSGGFIGVDVFFVLSGYLITSLLLVEITRTGRISIKNFYVRRARRLLPALFAMMLAVGTIGVIWLPEQVTRLRGDLIASLGYASNWWLIREGSSYFGAGEQPPLLTHLWSLAVEEQFYLLWPLIIALFLAGRWRFGHAKQRSTVLTALIVVLIAASTGAAWLLRWLGDRSYAIYLWHWPVCVLTRPGMDVPLTGWANSALRIALTLALAELSYWAIEHPIRRGDLFRLRSRLPLRLVTAGMSTTLLAGGIALGWQLTERYDGLHYMPKGAARWFAAVIAQLIALPA